MICPGMIFQVPAVRFFGWVKVPSCPLGPPKTLGILKVWIQNNFSAAWKLFFFNPRFAMVHIAYLHTLKTKTAP